MRRGFRTTPVGFAFVPDVRGPVRMAGNFQPVQHGLQNLAAHLPQHGLQLLLEFEDRLGSDLTLHQSCDQRPQPLRVPLLKRSRLGDCLNHVSLQQQTENDSICHEGVLSLSRPVFPEHSLTEGHPLFISQPTPEPVSLETPPKTPISPATAGSHPVPVL